MKKTRVKFYVERTGFWTQAAVIFMALSIVFRLIGCWGLWNDQNYLITQIALPVGSGLLFILFLSLLGKVAVWTTFLPVLGGVVFFILKAVEFDDPIHMVLCIALYVLVAVLYSGTVFTVIKTKWLLVPLFALPFLYHVFVEDLAAMQDTLHPVTFAAGMQEMSVLCIMLSLLFTALALKKKVTGPKEEPPKTETAPGNAAADAAAAAAEAAAEAAAAAEAEATLPAEAPAAPAEEEPIFALAEDPVPDSDSAPPADAGSDS